MPAESGPPTRLFVSVFSDDLLTASSALAVKSRTAGIPTELGTNPGQRLDRQFKYADIKGIPFVAVIGPDEVEKDVVTLKNLRDGSQQTLPAGALVDALKRQD